MKLYLGTGVRRQENDITFSNEVLLKLFEKTCNNPIFSDWGEMQINRFNKVYDEFNYEKIIKAINSPKKDLTIFCYGEGSELVFSRDKINYNISLHFTQDKLGKNVEVLRDFMVELTLFMPFFDRLVGLAGMEIFDTQKKHNLPQEKSFLGSMPWLNVLSPLGYKKYYEKEDLLSAPFYDVREIAPDIVFIQAYKDPFNVDNEESLNYLRNGINHLNKNLLFFKYK